MYSFDCRGSPEAINHKGNDNRSRRERHTVYNGSAKRKNFLGLVCIRVCCGDVLGEVRGPHADTDTSFEFPTAVGIAGSKQRRRARAGGISAGLSERAWEHWWIELQLDSTGRCAATRTAEMRFEPSQHPAKF
jgi:hypothetical protein